MQLVNCIDLFGRIFELILFRNVESLACPTETLISSKLYSRLHLHSQTEVNYLEILKKFENFGKFYGN